MKTIQQHRSTTKLNYTIYGCGKMLMNRSGNWPIDSLFVKIVEHDDEDIVVPTIVAPSITTLGLLDEVRNYNTCYDETCSSRSTNSLPCPTYFPTG